MTTRLEGPLRREIDIGGEPWTLTITPEGFRLVPKGKRNGYALAWRAFVSGDTALVEALQASVRGPASLSGAPDEAPDGPERSGR